MVGTFSGLVAKENEGRLDCKASKRCQKIGPGRRLGAEKRLFDVGWPDESKCQACHTEEGTEKHRLYHCPAWYEVRREITEASRKCEHKARTSKKEWKWQKEALSRILSLKAHGRGVT